MRTNNHSNTESLLAQKISWTLLILAFAGIGVAEISFDEENTNGRSVTGTGGNNSSYVPTPEEIEILNQEPENVENTTSNDSEEEAVEDLPEIPIDLPLFVDSELATVIATNGEVEVLVKVRDTTNILIPVSAAKQEKDELFAERTERLKEKTQRVLSRLSESDATIEHALYSGRGFTGTITASGLAKLSTDPNVAGIYMNRVVPFHLGTSRGVVNADDADTLGFNGTGQSVCVLDTGIDYDNTALGNGCYGLPGCKVRQGYDFFDNDGDADDTTSGQHGTNVAGIIGSTHATTRGVAAGASLIAIRVCNDNGCNTNDIVQGLDFCHFSRNLYNITTVSMSLGGGSFNEDCTTATYTSGQMYANDELNDLYVAGMTVVSSTGNNGQTNGISYPSCAPHVISVGATYDANLGREPDSGTWRDELGSNFASNYDASTSTTTVTSFTNRVTGAPDVVAPGCRIESPRPSTTYYCGTSQAAPHVSAAAAILRQVDSSITPDEIEQVLRDTGVAAGNYRRIDIQAAINEVRDSDGDGYQESGLGGNDCNDDNGAVYPGATEVCDDRDNDCDGTTDEGCESECTIAGYESCFETSFGACSISVGFNDYALNTINWGPVADSFDPYVAKEYNWGWKAIGADQVKYNYSGSCGSSGCSGGTSVPNTGTKIVTTAGNTAKIESFAVWADASNGDWCSLEFDDFIPSYSGGSEDIHVVGCYSNSDCTSGQYCNKAGSWTTWSCVAKKSSGQTCTGSSECSSAYCDVDGEGSADDSWCFTPTSSYFDSQESTYCEYSIGNSTVECDEKQTGTDLNTCIISTYYETECSSTCGHQNITSTFECSETGCSCSQPLCDGLTTGSVITTCSAGQAYFADKCSSTAGGEDRGDSICRSSAFAAGCTADSQCNGVAAGTNGCSASCTYNGATSSIGITMLQPTTSTGVAKDQFFTVKTQTCCYGANCGVVQVSLDPEQGHPKNEYTYTSEKLCSDSECTTTHYATPRFGFEDGQWKTLDQLRSFKGAVPIDCRVDNDGIHVVECLDYNHTHRKLKITVPDTGFLGKTVPLRTLSPYQTATGVEMRENEEKRQTLLFTSFSKTKEEWYEANYYDEIHVGESSTNVTYVPTNATSFSGKWNATSGSLALPTWTSCAGNDYSGSDKTAISDGNGSTSIYGQGGSSGTNYTYCHWMKWQINENPSNISEMSTWADWTGSLNAGADSITKAFYIGNATGQKWHLLGTTSSSGGQVNHSGTINNSITNFVENSGGVYYVYTLLHYNATKPASSYAYSNFYDTQLKIKTSTGGTSSGKNITYTPKTAVSFSGTWEANGGTQAMYSWTSCNGTAYSSTDRDAISDSNTSTKIYGSGGGNSTQFSYCHWMKWRINETAANASSLGISARWYSDLHQGADTMTRTLFIGNGNTQTWEKLDQSTIGGTQQAGSMSSSMANYIRNESGANYVYVMLHFNATQDTTSNNSFSEFYDIEMQVTVNGSSPSTSKGLVSNSTGATPFYTNSSNPLNVTLDVNQCQNTTWYVNATGNLGTTHTFFAYANKTSAMGVSNKTPDINITIQTTATPPGLIANHTFCTSNEGWSGFDNRGDCFVEWNTATGGNAFSPDLDLNNYNSYKLVMKYEIDQSAYTKTYFKSSGSSLTGGKWMFENNTATANRWKHDGGSFSSYQGIPWKSNVTVTIYVNKTADTSKSEVSWNNGTHSGSSSTLGPESFTDSANDYIGIEHGTIKPPLRLRSVEVWDSG